MANVEGRISLSVTDDRGGGGTFLVHVLVPEAQTLTAANTAIGNLATLLATVSDVGIKEASFSLVETDADVAAGTDSNVGAGAVFDFNNSANPSTYGLFIPSFKPALISPDGSIDITGTEMAAFGAALTGAVMGGTYTNAQYIPNHEPLDAFLSNRKRKRRLRP